MAADPKAPRAVWPTGGLIKTTAADEKSKRQTERTRRLGQRLNKGRKAERWTPPGEGL